MISIISPVFEAEQTVFKLVQGIVGACEKLNSEYEIILVEDGSKDNSWKEIVNVCNKFNHVRGVKLSRNFGQHYAITCGINQCSGDYIAILDCDLQDNPLLLLDLFDKLQEGYDTVFTIRKNRKHNSFKKITALFYNLMFSFFSNGEYRLNYGSLVMFRKKVADEFVKLKEYDRLYIQLLKWLGFRQTAIEVEHEARHAGSSTYSIFALFYIAFQGLTSYSDKLLRLSIYTGFIAGIGSFILTTFIITEYFLHGFLPGWPSVISAVLLSTGLILISIGIAGIYIGKLFVQSKERPLYIVEEILIEKNTYASLEKKGLNL